jgi:hypothetical protein
MLIALAFGFGAGFTTRGAVGPRRTFGVSAESDVASSRTEAIALVWRSRMAELTLNTEYQCKMNGDV